MLSATDYQNIEYGDSSTPDAIVAIDYWSHFRWVVQDSGISRKFWRAMWNFTPAVVCGLCTYVLVVLRGGVDDPPAGASIPPPQQPWRSSPPHSHVFSTPLSATLPPEKIGHFMSNFVQFYACFR